jgi:hypothetical protein
MGAGGTERLAGVLGQCVALAHLDRGMTSALSGKGSFELRGAIKAAYTSSVMPQTLVGLIH